MLQHYVNKMARNSWQSLHGSSFGSGIYSVKGGSTCSPTVITDE